MPNYKTVRVEEKVYNRLAQLMLPRESFSETIERLLDLLEKVGKHVDEVLEFRKRGQK